MWPAARIGKISQVPQAALGYMTVGLLRIKSGFLAHHRELVLPHAPAQNMLARRVADGASSVMEVGQSVKAVRQPARNVSMRITSEYEIGRSYRP